MKTSPQHLQWTLGVALSLTAGLVTQRYCNVFDSNYEVLVVCIVEPWPGHQSSK